VNPARTNVVHRAVNLIGPDEQSRVACVNAVYLAFFEMQASDDDLRRMYHHRTKPAKIGLDRLHKDIRRLQIHFDNPDLDARLLSIFPAPEKDFLGIVDQSFLSAVAPWDIMRRKGETDRWLTMWLKRLAAAKQTKRGKRGRFHLEAEKKLIAAEEAHSLLVLFSRRKISAAKGSDFCQLTALLYSKPEADLQYACRQVLHSMTSKGRK
jgi:hypothetical protein